MWARRPGALDWWWSHQNVGRVSVRQMNRLRRDNGRVVTVRSVICQLARHPRWWRRHRSSCVILARQHRLVVRQLAHHTREGCYGNGMRGNRRRRRQHRLRVPMARVHGWISVVGVHERSNRAGGGLSCELSVVRPLPADGWWWCGQTCKQVCRVAVLCVHVTSFPSRLALRITLARQLPRQHRRRACTGLARLSRIVRECGHWRAGRRACLPELARKMRLPEYRASHGVVIIRVAVEQRAC